MAMKRRSVTPNMCVQGIRFFLYSEGVGDGVSKAGGESLIGLCV